MSCLSVPHDRHCHNQACSPRNFGQYRDPQIDLHAKSLLTYPVAGKKFRMTPFSCPQFSPRQF